MRVGGRNLGPRGAKKYKKTKKTFPNASQPWQKLIQKGSAVSEDYPDFARWGLPKIHPGKTQSVRPGCLCQRCSEGVANIFSEILFLDRSTARDRYPRRGPAAPRSTPQGPGQETTSPQKRSCRLGFFILYTGRSITSTMTMINSNTLESRDVETGYPSTAEQVPLEIEEEGLVALGLDERLDLKQKRKPI